jgi:3-isopropylmalate/(R)-2-methylmalate dehydratase large subunit
MPASLPPIVSWGTSPEDVVSIAGSVPNPDEIQDEGKRSRNGARSITWASSRAPRSPTSRSTCVFIGSCTNGRIEDLRAVAQIVEGRKVAAGVKGMIVPGSGLVKHQAEQEGLDKIFLAAGFEWREPGCSMCLGMNPDKLKPEERCASTSNRNFEGRQGARGRTHLMSPAMAAAAAIAGTLTDVRKI